MIDPKDSIFHKIYDFDVWIYSECMENWMRLAKGLEPIYTINLITINSGNLSGSSEVISRP